MKPRSPIILLCLLATAVNSFAQLDLRKQLQDALFEEEVNRDLPKAIQHYDAVVKAFDEQGAFAATALYRLGECYRKQGLTNYAADCFEKLVQQFPTRSNLVSVANLHLREFGRFKGGQPVAMQQAIHQNRPEEDAFPDEQVEVQQLAQTLRNSPDLIRAPYRGHKTPLHHAIDEGKLALTEFLLRQGASPTDRDNNSWPMLALAANAGHLEIARLLVKHGAGKEQAHLDMALIAAAANGFTAMTSCLIEAGADVNASQPIPPLFSAIQSNQVQTATLLLEAGADLTTRDAVGNQPLHAAIQNRARGDLDMIKLLLESGADIEASGALRSSSKSSQPGSRPLHMAVWSGRTDLTLLLLDRGADPGSRDSLDATPLHLATAFSSAEHMKLLLDHRADPNLVGNLQPWIKDPPTTPLGIAMRHNDIDNTKLTLLLAKGANPNILISDTTPKSPLAFALQKKWLNVAELLLKHGADPDFAKDDHPLIVAIDRGFNDLLQPLIDAGADVNRLHPNNFPLLEAVQTPDTNAVAILLSNGADPNLATPGEGRTALDVLSAPTDMGDGFGFDGNDPDHRTIIRKLLLDAGASYLTGHPQGLTLLRRENGQKWTALLQEDHPYLQMTLLEFIALAFDNQGLPSQLLYPDLSRITLHRRQGDDYAATNYNALVMSTNSAAPNPLLKWGDIVEIPEALPRKQSQTTLPQDLRAALRERLKRKVALVCHGVRFERTLYPLALDRITAGSIGVRLLPPMESSGVGDMPPGAGETLDSCWLSHLLQSKTVSENTRREAFDDITLVRHRADGSDDVRFELDMGHLVRRMGVGLLQRQKNHAAPMSGSLGFWLRAGDEIRIGKPLER